MDIFSGPIEGSTFEQMICRALITELAADDTYTELLKHTDDPEIKEVLEEIRGDENNHAGRLLGILTDLRGDKFTNKFEDGFAGKE